MEKCDKQIDVDGGLVSVKIRAILDEPNMNGLIINKSSFLKEVHNILDRGENLYITKTLQSTERFTPTERIDDIEVDDILGIIHAIDLEHKSAYVEPICISEEILDILSTSTFGFRAVGSTHKDRNGNTTIDIIRLISFDLVN